MRNSLLPLIAGLTLAAAATSSGAANVPTLEAAADAGACGGSVGCSNPQDVTISPATGASLASAMDASSLVDGSYADAQTSAAFGALHINADAYRVAASDAQSHNDARSTDYLAGASITGGVVNDAFVINGSVAAVDGVFGNASQVYLDWDNYDVETGKLLDRGSWESTDAMPTAFIKDSFSVPLGHDVELFTEFSSFVYSSYSVVDFAHYANTLHEYLSTATPGPDLVGLSGHDYAAPPPAGVPEPASWAMILAGLGLMGGVMRRRSARFGGVVKP